MRFIQRIRALATGTVLVASTVLLAGPAWSAPAAPAPPDSPDAGAEWVWPLRPRPPVVHEFDPPDKPWGSGHRGVDLLGTEEQRVRSTGDGVVTYAGTLAGRGVISVTHGKLRSTYEPVEAVVEEGDRVQAGDVIGRLQPVASHCAPRHCLHWGVLRDSTYLDPLGLVGASGTVRLLPLHGAAPEPVAVQADRSVRPPAPPAGPWATADRSGGLARLAIAVVAGLVHTVP